MKKIYIKIICFFTVFLILNTAFCFTGEIKENHQIESNQTIKELNEGIFELNKDNQELNFEYFLLNRNLKLKSFFRDDLENFEVKNIEYIINYYVKEKNNIDEKLKEKAKKMLDTQEEKKILLNEKKDFYKKLLPYIRKDKIIDYLDYISQDVKILKEKKDLNEKIIIKQEIIINKVEKLEEKIKEHRDFLNEKFQKLIVEQIELKIEKLKTSEKFLILSLEDKKLVLNKIIRKIKISISNIDSKVDKTDVLLKKLEIYNIILSQLEKFRDSLE